MGTGSPANVQCGAKPSALALNLAEKTMRWDPWTDFLDEQDSYLPQGAIVSYAEIDGKYSDYLFYHLPMDRHTGRPAKVLRAAPGKEKFNSLLRIPLRSSRPETELIHPRILLSSPFRPRASGPTKKQSRLQ